MRDRSERRRTVIALDVDGTLFDGVGVAVEALEALGDARRRGHTIIIVSGRRFETLADVVPDVLPLCALFVTEEGGVVHDATTGRSTLLAPPIDEALIAALLDAGVTGIDIGRVAIGADRRFEATMRAVYTDFAADREVVVNKGSVALVPRGCDKGTGLRAALAMLGCADWPVLAVGDAENDLPMFAAADFAAAVANADDAVMAAGITVMQGTYGAGVAEAVRRYVPD
jgi:hydroxymethylpyrimidine pyrophosphatase-like HAD family hydrolase